MKTADRQDAGPAFRFSWFAVASFAMVVGITCRPVHIHEVYPSGFGALNLVVLSLMCQTFTFRMKSV